ncbi:4Fe-4S binding protein [Desulfobacca acetoxidans]|uniref:4Fe-4S ferredoxin iron-sulfur binding domain-containing protein n=1 Tax=Desulfobacca acetoxidans (strain ATCC 700848 / DSM 11109 / ASRB2) TaxID=880072 RepID=F2NCN8_DESAR|nr:4Fe-4S binding protein [Desulfobacca acetoxidans]AEB09172.1 4Fe-4S ferredoxin iron-sulfur binding domain-containing protein [Desulfobacca acetoxidans DSM 11109]HAY22807.1 4Fe-4S ferredoxin [Desulfobacterales bacterium]
MKIMRKIIEIDPEKCDGCGQCVPSCAEGAIQIVEGKAQLVAEKYCDGLGACLGECPRGALRIIEREADDFDEHAVEEYLKNREQTEPPVSSLACGCPSIQVQSFAPLRPSSPQGVEPMDRVSALSNWPVKIKLVPPDAPFLKHADLLVLADCSALAYPGVHQELLPGKVVLIGCPKFDDIQEYIEKFAAIFQKAEIRHVTTVIMEVPCCAGLGHIVEKGMAAAGKRIPHEQVVIGAQGQIVSREKLAA